MNTLQRYAVKGSCSVEPTDGGSLVLFADVEPALRSATRFEWVRPLVSGDVTPEDTATAERRGAALFAAYRLGLRGVEMVDDAMRRCPQ